MMEPPDTYILDDVAACLDNRRSDITKEQRTPGIYPYYGAGGIADYIDQYNFDGEYFLLSEKGKPITAITAGKCWISQGIHVFEFEDPIVMRFTACYLDSIDLTQYTTGAMIPTLTKAALKQIRIPNRPVEEMAGIVQILDLLRAAIDRDKIGIEESIKLHKLVLETIRDQLLDFKRYEREES